MQSAKITFHWVQQGHLRSVSREHTIFRDDNWHVQYEVVVPRRGMKAGRPHVRYYIDEDPREFRTETELANELNLQSISK